MRLAVCLSCAGMLLLPLAGCGGGGHHDSGATAPAQSRAAAIDGAVRAAAAAAAAAPAPDDRCARTLTPALVRRIYGSAARCRRVQEDSASAPDFAATATAARVSGLRAVARVSATDGDTGARIAGTVRLRYTPETGWRVDDFSGEELRGGLGTSVAAALKIVKATTESRIDACVRRRFAAVSDRRVQQIAYGVMGRRTTGLRAAFRALGGCRSGAISLLRRLFEAQVKTVVTALPPATHACLRRGLRVTLSDAFIARFLAAGGTGTAGGLEQLAPHVRRVVQACGGATGALDTTA